MSDNDLLATDGNTSSQGQSEDYKVRWQGLQTSYNQLKAERDSIAAQLEAKSQVAETKASKVMELEQKIASLNVQYQGQLTDKDAVVTTLQNQIGDMEKSISTYERKQKVAEDKQKIRVELARHPEVLPFFESGFLNLMNEDGEPLEGEELTAKIGDFKSHLGQRSEEDLEKTLEGTVPSKSAVADSPLTGGDEESLLNWLMENPDHEDYDSVADRHSEMVARNINK